MKKTVINLMVLNIGVCSCHSGAPANNLNNAGPGDSVKSSKMDNSNSHDSSGKVRPDVIHKDSAKQNK